MRKITTQMQSAVYYGENFKLSNTQVISDDNETSVLLHGNEIYKHDKKSGVKSYSSCGWESNTSKERLNALLVGNVHISQKAYTWYLVDNNNPKIKIEWFDGITNNDIVNKFQELRENQK